MTHISGEPGTIGNNTMRRKAEGMTTRIENDEQAARLLEPAETAVQVTVPHGGLPIIDVTGHGGNGTELVQLYICAEEMRAVAHLLLHAARISDNGGSCRIGITWDSPPPAA